ncbi:MAG TPA: hypothetical protein VGC87_09790 [Pyrinomonadaceae bacterium]|jgi:hypothetical protein
MTLSGIHSRRVHISGSANKKTDSSIISYAHYLVSEVVQDVLLAGGGLVIGAGKEPRLDPTAPDSPSLTFDWTALESAFNCIRTGSCAWGAPLEPPLVVVTSEKAESEIPDERRPLWRELLNSNQVRLEFIRVGARSGAMLRERQAQYGDILLTLGGGTGVEHLADLYIGRRRPVVPLDLPLGASRDDGTGGSERLAREALAEPGKFFTLQAPFAASANAFFYRLATRGGKENVHEVVKEIINLLQTLTRPKAFYTRLLNPAHPAFPRVEAFFRDVVDPFVEAASFERVEIGTNVTVYPYINVSIFEELHYADVAVIDVTGERPNCFIELGYALGRGLRVIMTAEEGTSLPFDQQAMPCHFWTASGTSAERQAALEDFWRKNVNRPPLVGP